jgi:hypothetical protein
VRGGIKQCNVAEIAYRRHNNATHAKCNAFV